MVDFIRIFLYIDENRIDDITIYKAVNIIIEPEDYIIAEIKDDGVKSAETHDIKGKKIIRIEIR